MGPIILIAAVFCAVMTFLAVSKLETERMERRKEEKRQAAEVNRLMEELRMAGEKNKTIRRTPGIPMPQDDILAEASGRIQAMLAREYFSFEWRYSTLALREAFASGIHAVPIEVMTPMGVEKREVRIVNGKAECLFEACPAHKMRMRDMEAVRQDKEEKPEDKPKEEHKEIQKKESPDSWFNENMESIAKAIGKDGKFFAPEQMLPRSGQALDDLEVFLADSGFDIDYEPGRGMTLRLPEEYTKKER